MLLRASTPAARGAVLAFAALASCFLIFFSIRNALAVADASRLTLAGLERATRLEPSNFANWFTLGRYLQYNLESPNPARAIASYQTALALNPRSADAWLDLGTAFEAEDNPRAAENAFLRAREEYPASAEVAWRYGNFLLRRGNLDAAFSEIRRAVAADPQRASEALSRCLRVDPRAPQILDRVIPPSSAAYLSLLSDFSDPEQLPILLDVWKRTVALHPKIPFFAVFRFIEELRQTGHVAEAWRAWREAATLAGYPDLVQPPDSLLWDGGFESGVRDASYAWRFAFGEHRVQFQLDQQHHSGKLSLRAAFDGRSNLSFTDACHWFPAEQGATYRLSAWIRTQDLTTDQGVRFLLRAQSGAAPLATPEVHGTHPWTLMEATWTAPAGAAEAEVCLTRFPSDQSDGGIRGVFWVDDVSIVPMSNLPANP